MLWGGVGGGGGGVARNQDYEIQKVSLRDRKGAKEGKNTPIPYTYDVSKSIRGTRVYGRKAKCHGVLTKKKGNPDAARASIDNREKKAVGLRGGAGRMSKGQGNVPSSRHFNV